MSNKSFFASVLYLIATAGAAFSWQPSRASVPMPPQEFRAVWVASVYNLDWPSKAGLPAGAQKAELIRILNTCAQLRINALILQVRPNSDALYNSSLEPWSSWLSGAGVNPGYDPLAFAISQAHMRGIELHAWLNPFRAKANVGNPVGRGHISLAHPEIMKQAGSVLISDPGIAQSRRQILNVIGDIVTRYDIDGIHLDDYFYPYPPAVLRDGKSPSQRRAYIDSFVEDMYSLVKSKKPWVRVGISPFGIWRPGVPAGIEAGVDAYNHLACDARKWLSKGWVDYLAPQLYWRCSPQKQSFPALMQWWAAQGNRPVWPGIASARIKSSEDPGRPASEISSQISYSRSLSRAHPGQCFWSVKSIMQNKDGIQEYLRKQYPGAAVPPPMPWSGTSTPGCPSIASCNDMNGGISMSWNPSGNPSRKWVIQARYGSQWGTLCILPAGQTRLTLPASFLGNADAIAVRGVSPYGSIGEAAVITQ